MKAVEGFMSTFEEASAAIQKYQKEWDEAGTESREVLIILDSQNEPRYVFASNEDREVGLHNAGITSNDMFKRLGLRTVIGKVTYAT
jgi:hypothetical protein